MNDWKENCRRRLQAHLDEHGDLAPPWAQFPEYERYTLGWRMGVGEDWLGLWHVFVEQLPKSDAARLAYLRRHPAAPLNWADHVDAVLRWRDDNIGEYSELSHARVLELEHLGLVGSDVAFSTWLDRQRGKIVWPWLIVSTPETAARYHTRAFWFWSRQALLNRGTIAPPSLPDPWSECREPLLTGNLPTPDLARGLHSMAMLLCAGRPPPPWRLGLSLSDFEDSFEDDMGYVDAFRLWAMSCFDDVEQLRDYCSDSQPTASWQDWLAEETGLQL